MKQLALNMLIVGLLATVFFCCSRKSEKPHLFEVKEAAATGLNFTNRLAATDSFNVFKYMYFYNGAGVGAGDFNNDGLIDLFFASNQQDNKLFINKGNLKFEDVTTSAKIPQDHGWSTGISVVDINNDGLLDIYVCRVGNFETLRSKNQLLVCTGIQDGVPVYKDMAAEYGIDFSGFSTQAAFLDYDGDGDLDLFLLNHTVHQNGTFAERSRFVDTYHPLSGDRLFRNDGNVFTDVTRQSGIQSSAISYGLGIAVSDINLDGYADIYIGNDFHENDYLYINQRNGTFREELNDHIMHTSQFSMGVDVADVTNDGYPEIISMDMLPSDPYILKRSLGEDEYNTFHMKIRYGYNYQYTRNNLQLNRRNGMFSEVGLYSGIAATDWSWAPLWFDFDNDGYKDLFVSNGIPKRLNDIDYVNYVSNDQVQRKINANRVDEKEMAIIDKFPQIKIPNKIYRNGGNAAFTDVESAIANNKITYSNGAVYADFDNDGDLDIVVSNIDDPVLLYENKTSQGQQSSAVIKLDGPPQNVNAIGARVVLFCGAEIRTYEKSPVHGFMSSMEIPLHIGLKNTRVDSAVLIWPDNTFQKIDVDSTSKLFTYTTGLPVFDYDIIRRRFRNSTTEVKDITTSTGIDYVHKENPFNEFDREPLIPFMVSRDGPALAVGDINGDGLDDVFIGSSKFEKSAVYVQGSGGRFSRVTMPALDTDSTYEDVDACFVDVNGDRHPDLVVASGGNEYYGKDQHLLPRIYLNDGKGNFIRKTDAFDVRLTASCVAPYDVNGDGFVDLFVGGRAVPWEYGDVPTSYLLINDGTGKFTDATTSVSNDLQRIGFVKSATWIGQDQKRKSLLITTEWGGIYNFQWDGSKLKKTVITDDHGWWNFALPVDLNGDGHLDFVAGNLGLNSRLKASVQQPVRMYYNDFDNNGKKEQVLTFYLSNKEIPFANKDELQKQIPILKKKFLYAEDFAKASLQELFGKDKLSSAEVLTATNMSNSVFLSDGKLQFTSKALPWVAQLSTYKDAVMVDANRDSLPDILLVGNFYDNNIQMGRYDADFGLLLINRGGGNLEPSPLNGLNIKGQVKRIKPITIGERAAYILARNNEAVMVIQFNDGTARN